MDVMMLVLQILHLVAQPGFSTAAYPYYSRATQEAVFALMLASTWSDGDHDGVAAWSLDVPTLARTTSRKPRSGIN